MFYIHQTACISAQPAFADPASDHVAAAVDNKFYAIDSNYDSIPPNVLRRLGKAVKMGIATGHSLISKHPVDGIVLGTANGGLEDCIKFLNQIIEFEEGRLTPTNFVQSTTNAIAGQLGIMSSNKGYNITHVHRGLAFENALIDIEMLLNEYPSNTYLLGGVDEISAYNYTIEKLAGTYKSETISSAELLSSQTTGTIAGEGAAMFLVNTNRLNAAAAIKGIKTYNNPSPEAIKKHLEDFLAKHLLQNEKIDLLFSGKNGDVRLNSFYEVCQQQLGKETAVCYYKQLTGDFPTVTALALWFATRFIEDSNNLPVLNIKKTGAVKNILLYNTYKGYQHSFILVSAP